MQPIKGIDTMYIRNKLDLIESTLQLLHDENKEIAKGMCNNPQYAEEMASSWDTAMSGLIERYKENTRMEGNSNAKQV